MFGRGQVCVGTGASLRHHNEFTCQSPLQARVSERANERERERRERERGGGERGERGGGRERERDREIERERRVIFHNLQ